MADVKQMALRAAQINSSGNALTEAEAIGKAIRGQGITYKADVERLMRQVGSEYARNKRAEGRKDARRR